MKIVCTKSNLVKGVSIVSKAVPSKTTMSILECVLIDATTDIIRLTANDMELGIQTEAFRSWHTVFPKRSGRMWIACNRAGRAGYCLCCGRI